MNNINVILVSPSLPENIGMVARVCLNFCVNDITLISPKSCNWRRDSNNASVGAFENLNISVLPSLADALQNSKCTFGFSIRKRDMSIPIYNLANVKDIFVLPYNTIIQNRKNTNSDIKKNISLVFGNEASGLSNLELSYCNYLIHIETNKDFASLNLSHSVAIVLYHIQLIINEIKEKDNSKIISSTDYNNNEVANIKEIDSISAFICSTLSDKNFLSSRSQYNKLHQDINNIMKNSKITSKEVRLLFKVLKQISN